MSSLLSVLHLAINVLQACALQDLSIAARASVIALATSLTIALCIYFLVPSKTLQSCRDVLEDARSHLLDINDSALESGDRDLRFREDYDMAKLR